MRKTKRRTTLLTSLVTMLVSSMVAQTVIPPLTIFAQEANQLSESKNLNLISQKDQIPTECSDFIDFGDEQSEKMHDFKERLTVKGIDDKNEIEYKTQEGLIAGGGLGHGLPYRYIGLPRDGKEGKLEFTVKADPTQQNYITLRLSGTQQGRGNLLLYGPDGDTRILNPKPGAVYSELDNGYQEGSPYAGRYYYTTYRIPQEMISADGMVTLCVMAKGKFDAYGTSKYKVQTQNSKYIYSAAIHTDPFYVPENNLKGEAPKGSPAEHPLGENATPYEYLLGQQRQILEMFMSYQLHGEEFEKFKTESNAYLEGAVVTYTPIKDLAKFNGKTKDAWARKVTQNAINYQNWSPMMATEIFTNAFMNDWSGDHYHSVEMLERIFKLYDFFARAQDKQGAWCVPTKGEDAGKWIGASLDGSGERGKGEVWPLLSLGVDSMMQTIIQLDYYIQTSNDAKLKKMYNTFLDEKIDHNLTGKAEVTRRVAYMEMFSRVTDYLANPVKGDFYDPSVRAGTANQDFCFAYDANRVVQLLMDTVKESKVDTIESIPKAYHPKDATKYLHQLKYKFGEMIDGEKWFSDNGLGLEGGASHGGWAGEYGMLLLKVINKYAESAQGDEQIEPFFKDLSTRNYDTAQYYLLPTVDQDGVNTVGSQMHAGSRNTGHGIKRAYPFGSYTALEARSEGALAVMMQYIEDNAAYRDDFISEMTIERSPHLYTRAIELQELLKYYEEVEALKVELEKKDEVPYLPMDDRHEDFAFADVDAQSVAFKNKGDKVYMTLNYRRDNWQYNNYARVRFLTDEEERLADITTTSEGGVYTYTDTKTHPQGKAYTHYRADGFTQAEYGKYAVGMNQSKEDLEVGQEGKVYTMDTLGIKKAKDLMTGTIYESENGKDIEVKVQPRQTVILEILEKEEVCKVAVKYVADNELLGYDNIPAVVGDQITVKAKFFDGYKLEDSKKLTITVSTDESQNIVEFNYSPNQAPIFNTEEADKEKNAWKVTNIGDATGNVEFDENKNPIAISSKGIEADKLFSSTFLYKEVTGDVELKTRLAGFKRTASDSDYLSLLITDSLDLENANYVQLRHFTNNNNILLVSHDENQGKNVKGYWAGDMNNKKVPILFKFKKEEDRISYLFSLDEGKTYEKTSKPEIAFDMGDKLYVGFTMMAATGVENAANISQTEIIGDEVVRMVVGEELKLDFGVVDPEGDEITYHLFGLPREAVFEESTKELTFKPSKEGSYLIKAEAKDDYHVKSSEKVKEVVVGKSEDEAEADGTIPKIEKVQDIIVENGETISFETKADGAVITMNGNYPDEAKIKDGQFVWNTKEGDAGTYHVAITYEFEDYILTKIVKIIVNGEKAEEKYTREDIDKLIKDSKVEDQLVSMSVYKEEIYETYFSQYLTARETAYSSLDEEAVENLEGIIKACYENAPVFSKIRFSYEDKESLNDPDSQGKDTYTVYVSESGSDQSTLITKTGTLSEGQSGWFEFKDEEGKVLDIRSVYDVQIDFGYEVNLNWFELATEEEECIQRIQANECELTEEGAKLKGISFIPYPTAQKVAESITELPSLSIDDTEVKLPPKGIFKLAVATSSHPDIIGLDGRITTPEIDTDVSLTLSVTRKGLELTHPISQVTTSSQIEIDSSVSEVTTSSQIKIDYVPYERTTSSQVEVDFTELPKRYTNLMEGNEIAYTNTIIVSVPGRNLINTELLQESVDRAEIIYRKLSQYEGKGKTEFIAALEKAREVLSSPMSQIEVDIAKNNLDNTIKGLRIKDDGEDWIPQEPETREIPLAPLVPDTTGETFINPFKDIDNHWAKDNILYIVEKGLFKGINEDEFAPNQAITRGMLVTIIGRLEGEIEIGRSSFIDVNDDAYYVPYIAWAADNNIVEGMGNNKFEPNSPITREQMAVVLANYMNYIKIEWYIEDTENLFEDEKEISEWAKDSVKAMKSMKLIKGVENNRFEPKAFMTRAEASVILRNLLDLEEK